MYSSGSPDLMTTKQQILNELVVSDEYPNLVFYLSPSLTHILQTENAISNLWHLLLDKSQVVASEKGLCLKPLISVALE